VEYLYCVATSGRIRVYAHQNTKEVERQFLPHLRGGSILGVRLMKKKDPLQIIYLPAREKILRECCDILEKIKGKAENPEDVTTYIRLLRQFLQLPFGKSSQVLLICEECEGMDVRNVIIRGGKHGKRIMTF